MVVLSKLYNRICSHKQFGWVLCRQGRKKECLNAAETSQEGEGIFAKETVKGVRVGQSMRSA